MIWWLALAMLLGAVVLAYVADSWRYTLAGVAVQYLTMSFLLLGEGLPLFGVLRLGIGAAAVLIIYLTLGQLGPPRRRGPSVQRVIRASREHPYRLAVLALTAVIAYGLAAPNPFSGLSVEGSLAAYFLGGSALLMPLVERQVLRDGVSLLFLDSALQFLGAGAVFETEFLPFALGSLATLLLALAVAFLITLQREVVPPGGRGE